MVKSKNRLGRTVKSRQQLAQPTRLQQASAEQEKKHKQYG